MKGLLHSRNAAPWRIQWAGFIESKPIQRFIIAVIILNAAIMGMETDAGLMLSFGPGLILIDKLCLMIFVVELCIKLAAYRSLFWRNGWNIFDFAVVAVALIPGAGVWAVLRSLRVLRVLRLLTVIPYLRKVVAAFLHSIPGLSEVVMVMCIFFYTAAILATNLFGHTHPEWFGSIGKSLFSLFQIMTLESWSMSIARPVMEIHPFAWAFFIPLITIATFTILNLFIGIIVSTMQELSIPAPKKPEEIPETEATLDAMEAQLTKLREQLAQQSHPGPRSTH
ncbi:MAG: ion transporter [Opitutales bacterium]|nr:ion transporter [Opitutales bacterium]